MNNKLVFAIAISLMLNISASAQAVTKDSINALKQQKEALKIGKRLNERKLELAKLQNSVEKNTQEMQNAAQKAQASAITNGEVANKLSTDAQNKSLANDASKSANNAKNDAKKARKAAEHLTDLQKDIVNLQKKIADDESKLAGFPAVQMPGNPGQVITTPTPATTPATVNQ